MQRCGSVIMFGGESGASSLRSPESELTDMRDEDREGAPVSDAPMLDPVGGEIFAVIREFCDMRAVTGWLDKALERLTS